MTTETMRTTETTLGPWVLAPIGVQTTYALSCRCSVGIESRSFRGELQARATLRHCPTHAAALEMWKAVADIHRMASAYSVRDMREHLEQIKELARALLRRIDEG